MTGLELLVPICVGALGVASGGAFLYHSKNKAYEKSMSYLKKGDPSAQVAYDARKNPKSLENSIDASWDFLYKITKEVMTIASEEDRKAIADAGKALLGLGCNYVHVPKYSMHHQKPITKAVDTETPEQQQQRG